MISEAQTFWELLPVDTRNFIVSFAANLASKIFPEKKKDSPVEKAYKEAFEEGLKYFVARLGDSCSYFIKDFLSDEKTERFFTGIIKIKDESKNKDTQELITPLINALEDSGIDISTIDGFDINDTVSSFLQGFTEKAEFSEALLPYWTVRSS